MANEIRLRVYSKRNWKRKVVWRWRLVAANNEIIAASSEAFSSKAMCINNLNLVREHIHIQIMIVK